MNGPCDRGVIQAAPAEPCDLRTARWVLAATILGSSMAFIDGTVVGVALPVIQASLRASAASTQWVVESYLLFLSALVLVSGSLADRLGRRWVFATGVSLFAAASAVCALAPDVRWLIASRALQGFGAALMIPSSLAILGAANLPADRGRAIGTWSSLTAVSTAIGPVLGGWLVQALSWRAVFFINVPIAVTVLVITLRKVPETRNAGAGRLDLPGALLVTLGLAALVFGLIEGPASGWTELRVRAPLAAGVVALVGFVLVEGTRDYPMLPLELFRNRTFAGANLLTLFLYAGLSAALFLLPFELIRAQGYSPSQAGTGLLPLVVLLSLLSRPAGAIADRFGPRLPLIAGPALAALGFFLLGGPHDHASYATAFLPALSVLGLGMAVTVAPLTTTVLNAVDPKDEGLASGVNNAVARVAGLLAIAALGLVPRGAAASKPTGSAGEAAGTFVASFGISMRLAAALAILASFCALALVAGPRPEAGDSSERISSGM